MRKSDPENMEKSLSEQQWIEAKMQICYPKKSGARSFKNLIPHHSSFISLPPNFLSSTRTLCLTTKELPQVPDTKLSSCC